MPEMAICFILHSNHRLYCSL